MQWQTDIVVLTMPLIFFSSTKLAHTPSAGKYKWCEGSNFYFSQFFFVHPNSPLYLSFEIASCYRRQEKEKKKVNRSWLINHRSKDTHNFNFSVLPKSIQTTRTEQLWMFLYEFATLSCDVQVFSSVPARISKGHGARLKKALTWSFKGTYDVTAKLSYQTTQL